MVLAWAPGKILHGGYRGIRRGRGSRFTKKQVRAIKAISQQPVETKSFPQSFDYYSFLTTESYDPSIWQDKFAVRQNIFAVIPRADSTATKTEQEVIGNELMARGFWIRVNVSAAVAPGSGHYGTNFRLTVYSIADVVDDQDTVAVTATDNIYDPDYTVARVTQQPFNTQRINVLKSHRWEARFDGNEDNYSTEHKMWIRLSGKKKSVTEEGLISSTKFGQLKGRNYYWLLEIYQPGASDIRTGIAGSIDTRVYFKDA